MYTLIDANTTAIARWFGGSGGVGMEVLLLLLWFMSLSEWCCCCWWCPGWVGVADDLPLCPWSWSSELRRSLLLGEGEWWLREWELEWELEWGLERELEWEFWFKWLSGESGLSFPFWIESVLELDDKVCGAECACLGVRSWGEQSTGEDW